MRVAIIVLKFSNIFYSFLEYHIMDFDIPELPVRPRQPPTAKVIDLHGKQFSGPTKQSRDSFKQMNASIRQLGGVTKQIRGPEKQHSAVMKQVGGAMKHHGGLDMKIKGFVKKTSGMVKPQGGSSSTPQPSIPAKNIQRPRAKTSQPLNANDAKAGINSFKTLNKSTNDIEEVHLMNEERKPRRSATKVVNYNDDIDETEFNKMTKKPSTLENGFKVDLLNRGKKRKSMDTNNAIKTAYPDPNAEITTVAPRAKITRVVANKTIKSTKNSLVTNAKIAATNIQMASDASNTQKVPVASIAKAVKNDKVNPPAKNTKIDILAPSAKISATNRRKSLITGINKASTLSSSIKDAKTKGMEKSDTTGNITVSTAKGKIPPFLKRNVNIRLVPASDQSEISYPWTWQQYRGTGRNGAWLNYPVSDKIESKGRKYLGNGRRGPSGQIKIFESSGNLEKLSDKEDNWFWKNSSSKVKVLKTNLSYPNESPDNFESIQKIEINTKADFMPCFNNNPPLSWSEAKHKCNECNIKYIVSCHLLAHNRRVHEKKQFENIDKPVPADKESNSSVKSDENFDITPPQFGNKFVSKKKELESHDDFVESETDVSDESSGNDMKDDYGSSDDDMENEDDISDEDIEMDEEVYCEYCDKEYVPSGEEDHSEGKCLNLNRVVLQ